MKLRIQVSAFFLASFLAMASMLTPYARAQQTLGGITGTVTDASGAIVADATVTLVGDQTKLTRSQNTNSNGGYPFFKPPPGPRPLPTPHRGFHSEGQPPLC